MSNWKKFSPEEIHARGILLSVKENDTTGEVRARMTASGIDVTITVVPKGQGGWQPAHSHVQVVEVTTILRGEVVHVQKEPDGAPLFFLIREGESFRTTPGRSHTLYVTGDTLMSTVKLYDSPDVRDWHADRDLDALVSALSYEEARGLAR